MRIAEIVTAFLLGILSVYLMWKSGEPPSWNPDVAPSQTLGSLKVKVRAVDSGRSGYLQSCF
jgi:hypothetical protein